MSWAMCKNKLSTTFANNQYLLGRSSRSQECPARQPIGRITALPSVWKAWVYHPDEQLDHWRRCINADGATWRGIFIQKRNDNTATHTGTVSKSMIEVRTTARSVWALSPAKLPTYLHRGHWLIHPL